MARPDISREVWDAYLAEDEFSYDAYEAIVIHYQYLVEGCARKLESRLPTYLEDSELVSFGQLGLLKAISRYDPDTGPFSRYASSVIYGAVIDGLRAADFAPRGLRKQQRDLDEAIRELQADGNTSPTNADIANALQVEESDVRNLQIRILKADVTPQDPADLKAYRPGTSLGGSELCREFVVWLREQELLTQKVIALRYWSGLHLKTISDILKIPVEQVRSRHQEVLAKILPFMQELAIDE